MMADHQHLLSASPGSLGDICEGVKGKGQHLADTGAGEMDHADGKIRHRSVHMGSILTGNPGIAVCPALTYFTNNDLSKPSHSPRQ